MHTQRNKGSRFLIHAPVCFPISKLLFTTCCLERLQRVWNVLELKFESWVWEAVQILVDFAEMVSSKALVQSAKFQTGLLLRM